MLELESKKEKDGRKTTTFFKFRLGKLPIITVAAIFKLNTILIVATTVLKKVIKILYTFF